jgi:phospholipid-binding lipoprotein MlaA
MRDGLLSLTMLSLALAASACAHRPADDPADPLEPVNRVVFQFNDKADQYVLRPAAKGYDYVAPSLVRRGVTNFFDNLGEPRTIVNDALQGKFLQSAGDLGRFLLNTTVGLGGLIDVASDSGLEHHDEDFGQTLGSWGIGEGWYLVIPLLGPSDNRDLVGKAGDWPLSPTFYLDGDHDWLAYSLKGIDLINFRANLLSSDSLVNQQFDKYLFFRTAFLQRRQAMIYDGNPPPEDLGIDDSDDAPAPSGKASTTSAPAPK